MGFGQIFPKGCAQRASINPAKDLADQIADRDGVVAAGCSWRPDRRHGRQPFADEVPVKPQGRIKLLGNAAQSSLMGQDLRHRDRPLALSGEGGPDRRDGLVIGQEPLIDEAGDHQAGQELGRRKDRRQGALIKGPGPGPVRVTGKEVDDDLAAIGQGKARADLLSGGEVLGEDLAHGGKSVRAKAMDLGAIGHQRPWLSRGGSGTPDQNLGLSACPWPRLANPRGHRSCKPQWPHRPRRRLG